ncbi:MAG: hypothetical protein U0Z26_04855 [Anaerolineales bacterium]
MKVSKWLAVIPPYLAVWAGMVIFHSAWGALLGFHSAILFSVFITRPAQSIVSLFKSKLIQKQAGTTLKIIVIGGFILCATCGISLYELRFILGMTPRLASQLASFGLTRFTLPAFMAYFSLVNPFLEEYFWRIHLGSDLKGFYIGDLAYASYHAILLINIVPALSILFCIACLTAVGWYWRQLSREDDGSFTSVLGHMVADFSIVMVVYILIK